LHPACGASQRQNKKKRTKMNTTNHQKFKG
jgi:hypothetical protein